MYWIMAIVVSVLYFIVNKTFSIGFLVSNMTSLNYYGLGGCFIEWYLSALIVFYAIFPALFKLTELVPGWILVLFMFVLFYICAINDVDWSYLCAIGRLPIFIMGIIMCRICNKGIKESNITKILFVFALAFASSILLYYNHRIHTYAVVYACVPVVILAISRLFLNNSKSNKVICWIGSHTLEIYVANTIVCSFMRLTDVFFTPALDYILLHIIFVPIMVMINNGIKNRLIAKLTR